MTPSLFGSSGIRGLVGVEITPRLATDLGAALGSEVKQGTVIVGRDPRASGGLLVDALAAGIVSTGVDFTDVGITTTPMLAFLTRELKANAGVCVTASHNPPDYNGFKIFDHEGKALNAEPEKRLESVILCGNFSRSKPFTTGKRCRIRGLHLYVSSLSSQLSFRKKWRIVVDLFNGATCSVLPSLFSSVGIDFLVLNGQLDPVFRLGRPEPSEASLHSLARMVKELGADIGFGYDGDGDRMVAVDKSGQMPQQDRVLAAYASHVVRKNSGGTVVTHVEASRCIEDAVNSENGQVVRTRVGDTSIAEAVRKNRAIFGGEPIGAWIHPQFHNCPDGVLSSMLLLKALEEEEKTLGEFVKEVKSYHVSRESLSCPNEGKSSVMEAVRKQIVTAVPDIRGILDVDGVRADFGEGWILVRPSGTEPLIRLTVESMSKETTRRMTNMVESIIREKIEAM